MKKYLVLSILLICFTLSLSACALGESSPRQRIDMTQEIRPDVTQTARKLSAEELYADYLFKYREAEYNEYYLADTSREKNHPELNANLLMNTMYFDEYHMYYAFIDLDGDGTQECLIGGGPQPQEVTIYEAYYCIGENPQKIFPNSVFGYREELTVYEDNTLCVWGETCAVEAGTKWYRFSGGVQETRSIRRLEDEYYTSVYGQPEQSISETDYRWLQQDHPEEMNIAWVRLT